MEWWAEFPVECWPKYRPAPEAFRFLRNHPIPCPLRECVSLPVSGGEPDSSDVPPQYPAEAGRARIEGTVVLMAVIGTDGTVKDVRIESGLPILAQAAIRCGEAMALQALRNRRRTGGSGLPDHDQLQSFHELGISTMQNKTYVSPDRSLATLRKRAQMLVLTILGGVILVVPMSAQSFEPASAKTGRILGTVVDTTDDPIARRHSGPPRAGRRSSHGRNKGRWSLCVRPSPGGNLLSGHCHS